MPYQFDTFLNQWLVLTVPMIISEKTIDGLLSHIPRRERYLIGAEYFLDQQRLFCGGLFDLRRGFDDSSVDGKANALYRSANVVSPGEFYSSYCQLLSAVLADSGQRRVDLGMGRIVGSDLWGLEFSRVSPRELGAREEVWPPLFSGQVVVSQVDNLGNRTYALETSYDFAGGKFTGSIGIVLKFSDKSLKREVARQPYAGVGEWSNEGVGLRNQKPAYPD